MPISSFGTGFGIGEFDPAYLFDRLFIGFGGGDHWIPFVPPIDVADEEAVQTISAHDGSSQAHKVYRGTKRHLAFDRKTFTFQFMAGDFDSFFIMKRVKASGSVFNFGVGMRFPVAYQITSGASGYRLPRDRATDPILGIPTINEAEYPTVEILDGVEAPGTVTFTGNTFTANATGYLELLYTPVHRGVISRIPESIAQYNAGVLDLEVQELPF